MGWRVGIYMHYLCGFGWVGLEWELRMSAMSGGRRGDGANERERERECVCVCVCVCVHA